MYLSVSNVTEHLYYFVSYLNKCLMQCKCIVIINSWPVIFIFFAVNWLAVPYGLQVQSAASWSTNLAVVQSSFWVGVWPVWGSSAPPSATPWNSFTSSSGWWEVSVIMFLHEQEYTRIAGQEVEETVSSVYIYIYVHSAHRSKHHGIDNVEDSESKWCELLAFNQPPSTHTQTHCC